MFELCKNSKKQGDIGLGMAISHYCSLGYTVSIPLTDSQSYDLIVDNGTIQRVQVKTTSLKKSGKYLVNMRTMGGNQKRYWCKKMDKSEVDILFILTDDHSIYIIPTKDIKSESGLTLSDVYKNFKV
jgi:hypothetical protein